MIIVHRGNDTQGLHVVRKTHLC
eukprot:COSAG06_NODE_50369_length_319_cov_0.709091_1_plen_22_part_10